MKNQTNLFEDSGSIDLEKLEDSKYLLDVLLQCEDILDANDAYCFENWIEGEILRGPIIKRHWVTFSLRYPFDKMPDPRFALRALKIGVQCQYERMEQEVGANVTAPAHAPNHQTDWMITITIPKRLLEQTDEADLENYDDEVDQDDVEAAQDTGIDDESQYQEAEQNPESEADQALDNMEATAPPSGPPQGTPRR